MKKKVIFFILVFITASAYSISIKDFDNTLEIGSGHSNGYIHLYGKDLYLAGPNINFFAEHSSKTDSSFSTVIGYSLAFVNLTSSSFLVNENMINQDLNDIFSTRTMLEFFFGNRNYLKLNNNNKIYFSYGFHTNLITLECTELLWLLFDTGFFAATGFKSQIYKNICLNFSYKIAVDFLRLEFSDYFFTDEFNDSLIPSDTFLGTNRTATIAIVIKM